MFFFFFSSRRRHTRFDCDWSSDVCSSDLLDFAETDPKDRGNWKVRYEEALATENRQQDMFYLLAEAMAAMASGKKAEFYRKRLQKGMKWDKQAKTWKWKE